MAQGAIRGELDGRRLLGRNAWQSRPHSAACAPLAPCRQIAIFRRSVQDTS